jgi:hypothetical protein
VAYSSYEVIGKWGILVEFWVYPKEYLTELLIILGAIVIATLIAILTPEGEKERLYNQNEDSD